MRIVRASVETVALPLTTPFRTALREVTAVDEIRVTLTTEEGATGIGSAAPTAAITGETVGSITDALHRHLVPWLKTRDLDSPNALFRDLPRVIVGNPSAKAAVDIALHDLYARRDGLVLSQWLGGGRRGLATDATVSLTGPEAMASQAESLVVAGFTALKVKLGGRDGEDDRRIEAVAARMGRKARLRVDANQAWTVRETLARLPHLAALGVEWVEQPIAAGDLEGLAAVRRRSPLPIAADEAVFGVADLLQVLRLGAADIVNIKLMKCAGIDPAISLIRLARAAGLQVMVGSMMEGLASVTAAAMVASAWDADYVDLDAGYFLRDPGVAGGVSYQGEAVRLPSGPGLATSFLPVEGGDPRGPR